MFLQDIRTSDATTDDGLVNQCQAYLYSDTAIKCWQIIVPFQTNIVNLFCLYK